MSERWTVEEAAAYLKVSPRTLKNWRAQQKGPPYHRYGQKLVHYIPEEVSAWAQKAFKRGLVAA